MNYWNALIQKKIILLLGYTCSNLPHIPRMEIKQNLCCLEMLRLHHCLKSRISDTKGVRRALPCPACQGPVPPLA